MKETRTTEIVDLQELPQITVTIIEVIKTTELQPHLIALIIEVVLAKEPIEVVPLEPQDTHNLQQEVVATTRIPEITAITEAQETPEEAIEVPVAVVMEGLPEVPLEVGVEAAVVAAAEEEVVAEEEVTKFPKNQFKIKSLFR